jgi:hypothetical protein
MSAVLERAWRGMQRGGLWRWEVRDREGIACRDQGSFASRVESSVACRDLVLIVVAIRSVVWTRVVEWVGCSVSATEMHQRCAPQPDEVPDEVHHPLIAVGGVSC